MVRQHANICALIHRPICCWANCRWGWRPFLLKRIVFHLPLSRTAATELSSLIASRFSEYSDEETAAALHPLTQDTLIGVLARPRPPARPLSLIYRKGEGDEGAPMQSHRTPIPRQTQMLTCHSWTRAFREEGFGAGRPHARGESGRFLSAPPHNTRVSPSSNPTMAKNGRPTHSLTHSVALSVFAYNVADARAHLPPI